MHFINDVMRKIWESHSDYFKSELQEYMQMDTVSLSNVIRDYLRKEAIEDKANPLTGLFSGGCPHWNQNGTLGGCSFCDFFTQHFDGFIMFSALQKKDRAEYGRVVTQLLREKRSETLEAQPNESITAFDSLNPDEVTPDITEELLSGQHGIFSNGFTVLSCETRATSVTTPNIQRWKKNVKGRLLVEFGVEVDNEWLRNNWINKGIANKDIVRAVKVLNEERCLFTNDLLLGIPGLSEAQSIALFVRAVHFCIDLGARHVVVSPLLKKGNNLQHFLSLHFGEDKELNRAGVTGGSSEIHVLSVFLAIHGTLSKYPQYARRIKFAPGHFHSYLHNIEENYKNTPDEANAQTVVDGLRQYARTSEYETLQHVLDTIEGTKFYEEHVMSLNGQHSIEQIKETMTLVSRKLSQALWKENREEYIAQFEKELESFSIGEVAEVSAAEGECLNI